MFDKVKNVTRLPIVIILITPGFEIVKIVKYIPKTRVTPLVTTEIKTSLLNVFAIYLTQIGEP
jgi:hypothetical protein